MEDLVRRVGSRGKSMDTDEMLRMPKKPSKNKTFEDLGRSFGGHSTTTRRDAKGTEYKHRSKHAKPSSTCSAQELTDSSEDEIDAFSGSQASRKSSVGSTPPRNSSPDCMSRINQSTMPTHMVLPALSFKRSKNKAKDTVDSNTKAGLAANRLSPSKQLHKTLDAHQENRFGSSSNLGRSSSQNSIDPEHTRTRGPNYGIDDSRAENIASVRPKPRPVGKSVKRSELEEIPVNSQANSKSQVTNEIETGKPSDMNLTRRRTLVRVKRVEEEVTVTPNARSSKGGTEESRSTLSTSKPTVKKPRYGYKEPERTPSPEVAQYFPVLSPLSTHRRANVHKSPSMPNLRSKQRSIVDRCESPTPRPREFPMSLAMDVSGSTSPKHASDKKEPKQIPRPRPKNYKSKKVKKVKEANSLFTESEGPVEEDEEPSRPAPQPFPMSTQILTSIGETDLPELSALKRASGDTSLSPKPRKKRKGALASPSNESVDGCNDDRQDRDEDFSMSLTVDPSLLCPFCDAPLPVPPTPHLKKLIRNAVKKSRSDTRPGNPLGRKAPSAVFGIICQRHQFESEELPKANANGWPSSIDWEKLGDRVKDMRDELEGLIEDLQAGEGVSVFWEEVQLELQKKGSRAVASVQGQFANFDKGQPGYYGELGYAIIHETLFDLFPPTSYNLDFIAPLAFKQFVQRVLVPEVAIRLIREDMDLHGISGSPKALQVLRDSSKYGVAMFPDDSVDKVDFEDTDQLGAADLIVMERARKRRKELEEEAIREEAEEEVRRIEKQMRGKRGKTKSAKGKSKNNKKAAEKENASEDNQTPPPRPRPKPKFRPTSQGSSFSHAPTLSEELTDDDELMNYCPSFLKSPQNSTENLRRNESLRAHSAYRFRSSEDEVLVQDSDADGDSEFAPTYARNSQSLTKAQSDIFAAPASSPDDIEVSSPVHQSCMKRWSHEGEEEEVTPKPSKVGRTGSSRVSSYPLLAARQRPRGHGGDESFNSNTKSEVPWLKSMISPGSPVDVDSPVSVVREDREHRWLLSDSCEE